MKRFVTYLYEYNRGEKGKNVGFIRVDLRDSEVRIEIHMRNINCPTEKGKVYMLANKQGIFGVDIGEVRIINGQSENRLRFPRVNIGESNAGFDDIIGIAVCFGNDGYFASNWQDEEYEELVNQSFCIFSKKEQKTTQSKNTAILLTESNSANVVQKNTSDLNKNIEDKIAPDLNNNIEDKIAPDLNKNIEDKIASDLNKNIEGKIASDLNKNIEDKIAPNLSKNIEDKIAPDLNNNIQHKVIIENKTEKTNMVNDISTHKYIKDKKGFSDIDNEIEKKNMDVFSNIDNEIERKDTDTYLNIDNQIEIENKNENIFSDINKGLEIKNQTIPQVLPSIIKSFRKIELSEIRSLPSPNWYLCNNSFLLHGFFNYHYLIIKKEIYTDSNKEKYYLGVPGVFERPEKVMAMLFGFPIFEELTEEMFEKEHTSIIEERKSEPNIGTFGGWFTLLDI